MKVSTTLAAAAAVGVGVIVRQVARSRVRAPVAGAQAEPRSRWRAVTVNKPPGEIAPDGALPEPLAELGDAVEIRITKAPDAKGTEIAVRLRDSRHGDAGQVRSALRRSKQLIEVGEVLRLDPQPAGRRAPTPAGKVLDAITRRAGAEGVL